MANLLYRVSQDVNNGYDTYDSMIVCAKNEDEARKTDPSGFGVWKEDGWYFQYGDGREELENHSSWANNIEDVRVEKIGKADKSVPLGIVLSSFHAG